MLCRTLPLLLLSLAASAAWAQSAPERDNERSPETGRLLSRVSGLFGGDLPQLDLPGTVKVILRPHFGDLIRRDYMRVEAGLRWALTDKFELSSEASVYFTHGLGGTSADGYGIGDLRFGSKYVFEVWPHPDYETTLAFNVDLPTGHPPIDMTDGHYHFAPSIVVQHQIRRYPRLTVFSGMGLDLIKDSRIAGTWGTNQPHDNSVSVTSGGVYDAGQLKWTLSATCATTAVIGSQTNNFFYLQPGVLWYVPSRLTFHSKTQWIVGLGARSTWGPDGFDFSLQSRLRAEITFRQVMDKMRGKSSPSP
jgi:hypothetical protein